MPLGQASPFSGLFNSTAAAAISVTRYVSENYWNLQRWQPPGTTNSEDPPRVNDLVFQCMDFRFRSMIDRWIRKNLQDRADLLSWPGVAKNLNNPETRHWVMAAIQFAKEKHQVSTVHIMHHQDCGGYGGSANFSSLKEEIFAHQSDLTEAGQIIQRHFPDITVKLYFVDFEQVRELERASTR